MHDPDPRFPRIPHLVANGAVTRDDKVAGDAMRRRLLSMPVVVEEKLDGANVSLRWDGTTWIGGTRAGAHSIDRAGIRSALTGWAWSHHDGLRDVVPEGGVLFGEWLGRRHALAYGRAPDVLIVLDLVDAEGRFLGADERDARCASRSLWSPPRLFLGVLGSVREVESLVTASRFGAQRMEGVVIRRESDGFLAERGKWVRSDFVARPPVRSRADAAAG